MAAGTTKSKVGLYIEGGIRSKALAGTGTAKAEILADGTLVRSEEIPIVPPTCITFDYRITTPSTMIVVRDTELGIASGGIIDNIRSCEAYFYDSANQSLSTVGIHEKVITRGTIAVDFTQQQPAGTTVRLLIIMR